MKLGTRGSQLALWQARTVAALIEQSGGPKCELVIIRTSGDEPPDPPRTLGTLGTPGTPGTSSVKSLFVKEIEEALLDRRVDLAVHSSKDLPVALPEGLQISGVLRREDPRDALLLPRGEGVTDLDALRGRLGNHPRIGTSSVRRVAQLLASFPAATFLPIRGNVDTRLRKLDAGEADAIVLATAGLKRLGLEHRISLTLPIDVCLPAPGQGTVAIETRSDDDTTSSMIHRLSHDDAMQALIAERAVVRALGGGCQMPLGAYAQIAGDQLRLRALVVSHDGQRVIREEATGSRPDALAIGDRVAQALLGRGAADIMRAIRHPSV